MLQLFIRAILIGLGASIPLGPLGIVCIQRTLSKGRMSGFSVGLGSSLGDTICATIAIFALSFVSAFLERNRLWVMLIGGIVVFAIGLQIAIKNPIKGMTHDNNVKASRYIQDALSGFIMTITNPGALVLMVGLFAFFGLEITAEYKAYSVAVVLAGIFLGTSGWWFILSATISVFRKRFRLRQLIAINRISGIIIAAIGLFSLAEGLFQMIFVK